MGSRSITHKQPIEYPLQLGRALILPSLVCSSHEGISCFRSSPKSNPSRRSSYGSFKRLVDRSQETNHQPEHLFSNPRNRSQFTNQPQASRRRSKVKIQRSAKNTWKINEERYEHGEECGGETKKKKKERAKRRERKFLPLQILEEWICKGGRGEFEIFKEGVQLAYFPRHEVFST